MGTSLLAVKEPHMVSVSVVHSYRNDDHTTTPDTTTELLSFLLYPKAVITYAVSFYPNFLQSYKTRRTRMRLRLRL